MEQAIFYSFLRGFGAGLLCAVILVALALWALWRENKK